VDGCIVEKMERELESRMKHVLIPLLKKYTYTRQASKSRNYSKENCKHFLSCLRRKKVYQYLRELDSSAKLHRSRRSLTTTRDLHFNRITKHARLEWDKQHSSPVCHSRSDIQRTSQIVFPRYADGDVSDSVQYHKGPSVKSATRCYRMPFISSACPTYVSLFDSFMQHGAKEHKRPNNGGSMVMYLMSLFFHVVKQSITIYIAASRVTSFSTSDFSIIRITCHRSHVFIHYCYSQKTRSSQKIINLIKSFEENSLYVHQL